jgi:predicted aminopeptidase
MTGMRVGLAILGLVALSSCGGEDVRYVLRAAYEEARILARREPIAEMLADDDLDPATRGKLELVLATRTYARDRLGLEVGGSYGSVASIDQDQIIHVVSAAYRDRLEPYTWWFPIAGTVPYRGYFERSSAVDLAQALESEGYDTYVRRALAFSTLGYFDDPLPSHLLKYDDEELVETIFHELLHGTVYFGGHSAFNESFANFVGHRGAIAFFAERGRGDVARRATLRWEDSLQFSRVLAEILEELEKAYASGVSETDRARLFAAARERYAGRVWNTDEFDRFATGPLNNAVLLARHVYSDRLSVFEEVFGRFDEDLPRSIEWVTQAARSSEDPFAGVAAALSAAPR